MTNLGKLISVTRKRARLSRQQLGARIGYTNVNKGARRIESLEAGQGDDAGILEKIIDALKISQTAVVEAIQLDQEQRRQRYLDAISTPIDPILTLRLMPTIYVPHPLPAGVQDPAKLELFACEVARKKGIYVHLVLPSRTSLWINPTGEVYALSEPDDEGQPVMPEARIRNKPLPGFVIQSLFKESTNDA